jgi:hypothetical protein
VIKLYMSGYRLTQFQFVQQKNVETFEDLIFQFEEQCLIHISISKKYFRPGGMALSEWTRSVRAVRDTPVADYSGVVANCDHMSEWVHWVRACIGIAMLWVTLRKSLLAFLLPARKMQFSLY